MINIFFPLHFFHFWCLMRLSDSSRRWRVYPFVRRGRQHFSLILVVCFLLYWCIVCKVSSVFIFFVSLWLNNCRCFAFSSVDLCLRIIIKIKFAYIFFKEDSRGNTHRVSGSIQLSMERQTEFQSIRSISKHLSQRKRKSSPWNC